MSTAAFIVVAVVVITLLAVAYGLYSRTGSGINAHPMNSEHGGAAAGAGERTAEEQYTEADEDRTSGPGANVP